MLKIIALSDTHMQFPELPEGDILIHCGDWTYMGKSKEIKKCQNWIDSQKHKFKHMIGIAGNHDFGMHKGSLDGINLLFDEEVEVEGLRIYGTPYTPMFFDWAFMETDNKLVERYGRIPEGLDILLTHGPPRGFLDINKRGDRCGSTALVNRLVGMDKPPKYNIFGHIHMLDSCMQRHVYYLGGINFYNVSYVNEEYCSTGEITEIYV